MDPQTTHQAEAIQLNRGLHRMDTFLITHRSKDLADGPDLYKTFRDKKDGCVKVVFNLG